MADVRSVTSVHNPAVQAARALRQKAERDEKRLFLCEGEHMAGEALAAGRAISVFVDEDRLSDYAALLEAADAPVYAVPARVMDALSDVKTPQGVVAVARAPEESALSALDGALILLEAVQDPGNVGTILRTLDAAGFGGCVLTPGCADPLSSKALRATMGSVFRVKLCHAQSAQEAARALAARGYATVAAALGGAPFYERPALPERVCLLIGNEGAGLSSEAIAACTHRLALPMRGGAESLNAAIAAAIMMYDIRYR